jgi:hypothetical protein
VHFFTGSWREIQVNSSGRKKGRQALRILIDFPNISIQEEDDG